MFSFSWQGNLISKVGMSTLLKSMISERQEHDFQTITRSWSDEHLQQGYMRPLRGRGSMRHPEATDMEPLRGSTNQPEADKSRMNAPVCSKRPVSCSQWQILHMKYPNNEISFFASRRLGVSFLSPPAGNHSCFVTKQRHQEITQ